MYEQMKKPKENKSQVVTNFVSQKKGNEKSGFLESQSEVIAQRREVKPFRRGSGTLVQRRYDNDPLSIDKYTDLISFWMTGLKSVSVGMNSDTSGVLGYRNMLTEEGEKKIAREREGEPSLKELWGIGLKKIISAGVEGWQGDVANGEQLTLKRTDGRKGGDSTERLILSLKTGYMDVIEAAIRIASLCAEIPSLTYIKISPPEDIYAGTGESAALYLTRATSTERNLIAERSKKVISGFAQLDEKKQPLTTTHLGGGVSYAEMGRAGASVSKEYGTIMTELLKLPPTEDDLKTAYTELKKHKILTSEMFKEVISDRTQIILHFIHNVLEENGMVNLGHFRK